MDKLENTEISNSMIESSTISSSEVILNSGNITSLESSILILN